MVIIVNECAGCKKNIISKKWCDVCVLLVPEITGCKLDLIPDEERAEKLRIILQRPTSRINDVWKSFRNIDDKYSNWAKEEKITKVQKRIFDWNEETNDYSSVFLTKDQHKFNPLISRRYNSEEIEDIRRLQRGAILPDGSHISWVSGNFFLDGEVIDIPYKDMWEILDEKTNMNIFNWKILLYSMSLATRNDITKKRTRTLQFPRHVIRSEGEKNIIVHPINILISNERDRKYDFIKDVIYNEANRDKDWLNEWNDYYTARLNLGYSRQRTVPISLVIDKGRLMIRVRRNDAWRKIRVPRDPKIWAILINWCLSIQGDIKRTNLECLQYYLFCDSERKIISDADVNGINFVKGIVESSDGRINLEPKKGFIVEGDSGLKYTVKPGRGPHESRFRVRADTFDERDIAEEQINRWMYRRDEAHQNITGKELCIVEQEHLRKLVLGDAIGSILMALLSDEKSRNNIDTLDKHLTKFERHKKRIQKKSEEGNKDVRFDVNQIDVRELERLVESRRELETVENHILRTGDRQRLEELRQRLGQLRERIRNFQEDFDDRHLI